MFVVIIVDGTILNSVSNVHVDVDGDLTDHKGEHSQLDTGHHVVPITHVVGVRDTRVFQRDHDFTVDAATDL